MDKVMYDWKNFLKPYKFHGSEATVEIWFKISLIFIIIVLGTWLCEHMFDYYSVRMGWHTKYIFFQ